MASQAKKDKFIAALTELGGSAGNGRLREALQWMEATYKAVKDDLLAEGTIILGRGRGGSVALAAGDDETEDAEQDAEAMAMPAAPQVQVAAPTKNAFQNHPSRDRRQMSEQASDVKA